MDDRDNPIFTTVGSSFCGLVLSRCRLRFIKATLISMSFLALLLYNTSSGWSCGVNSHIWITDSAICQLPEGSILKAFFSDQRKVDLTRLGSVFPDSGYAINHEYGELAHWSPFIQAYIEDFQVRHGQDSTNWSEEAKDEAAFIMGVAAHGYEDELFDSQFLRWVEQEDTTGQDVIDPAIDFLLIYEGHTELYPPLDFPVASAASALQRAGVAVTEEEVHTGVARVHQFALILTQNPQGLRALVERDAPLIPWASRHYLNRNITGSLAHEPQKVAALLEDIYDRLQGINIADSVMSHVDPSPPFVMDQQGIINRDQSRWISLYFTTGIRHESLETNVKLFTREGEEILSEHRGTRWGGQGYSRIFEISPLNLPAEQEMILRVNAGLELVNGEVSTSPFEQVIELCSEERCAPPELAPLKLGGQYQGCWVESTTDMEAVTPINDMMMEIELDQSVIEEDSDQSYHGDFGQETSESDQELDDDLTLRETEAEDVRNQSQGCIMNKNSPDYFLFVILLTYLNLIKKRGLIYFLKSQIS